MEFTSIGGRLSVSDRQTAALRFVFVLAAGVVFCVGPATSVARGAQDVDDLGKKLERSESQAERRRLLSALGRTRDVAAFEYLFPALDDENSSTRKRAGSAIQSILRASKDSNRPGLLVDEALSADLSAAGQMEVVGLLDGLSPPKQAAAAIFRFLERGDLAEHVARQCVSLVRKPRYVGLDVVRDGLLEQVEEGDVVVAAAAASALARMRLSDSERPEVVRTLLAQLTLGDDEAPIRSAAKKALGIITGEGDKSTGDWRSWAVKEDYGDPVESIPADEFAADRLPVVYPPVDKGPSSIVSSFIYVVVGVVAAVFVALLLILRSAYTKRATEKIEATRKKVRRRRS